MTSAPWYPCVLQILHEETLESGVDEDQRGGLKGRYAIEASGRWEVDSQQPLGIWDFNGILWDFNGILMGFYGILMGF